MTSAKPLRRRKTPRTRKLAPPRPAPANGAKAGDNPPVALALKQAPAANGAAANLADDLLYGSQSYADFLGWPLRRVRYFLSAGLLPSTKLGAVHVGSKRRLRELLGGEGAEK